MNKLIIFSGPTATGKTKSSLLAARYIKETLNKNVAIINFDSLLFYKEISIGTAKPTKEEMANIDHFLIDTSSIYEAMNAFDYIKLATDKIYELHQKNYVVILVGGSAFYLRALLKGMYQSISVDDKLQKEIDQLYQQNGIIYFINFLKEHDPEALTYLHENDHYRIIRAASHFKMTGTKISEQKKIMDENNPYDFQSSIHPWQILHFYLDLDKAEHYKLIQQRTLEMFQRGLIQEVQDILSKGASKELKPLQSIGYKEVIDLIEGRIKSESECQERISISTRQLAKSQRTFFKKITPKVKINPTTDQSAILENLNEFLAN